MQHPRHGPDANRITSQPTHAGRALFQAESTLTRLTLQGASQKTAVGFRVRANEMCTALVEASPVLPTCCPVSVVAPVWLPPRVAAAPASDRGVLGPITGLPSPPAAGSTCKYTCMVIAQGMPVGFRVTRVSQGSSCFQH